MKTSEDKLNEALRNVLKRKFDDYEEQPNPTALERIRARLKPPRTGSQWWFSGAMVLVIMSGLLIYRHATRPDLRERDVRSGKLSLSALPAETGKRNALAETRTAVRAISPAIRTHHLSRGPATKVAHTLRNRIAEAPVHPASRDTDQEPAQTADRQRNANGPSPGAHNASDDQFEHLTQTAESESFARETAANAGLTTEEEQDLLPIKISELASLPRIEGASPLRPREVAAPAFKPVKVIVTNPAKLAWLVNAAVLHSYQILTVPSSAAQDYQNFNFPSLFTARSMGYKVSAGVERKGIQLLLHYSGFRQTYSYEIARNSYLVTPDSKGQYHTVRQGDQIEEMREFSMLGLGVAKQVRWGHSPVSRFYAAFGAEYSHDLKSTQSLAWINLGLGKQFALTRHAALSIGPFAEFSPVKVKGITNPFYYQPYRVGISAGLRFVRP